MITSDNLEATDVIRTGMVLEAREAVDRGAYDSDELLSQSIDIMIDEAFKEERMRQAREALLEEEFQRMTESDR